MQQAHNLCYKFDDGKICIFGHNIALLRSHIKKIVIAKANHCAKCRMQYECNMCFTPMQQAHNLCYKFDDGKICIFGHNIALLRSHIKKIVIAKANHCAKCRMQYECNMCFTPMQQAHNLCYKFDDGKMCIFGHNIALLRSHIKKTVVAKAYHYAKWIMQHERNMDFTPMQQAHCLCYKFDNGKICIFGHNVALLRSHIKITVVAKACHCAKWRMQHERNMDFTPMQQTYCLCYKFDDGKICIFGHNVALLHSHIKKTVVVKACHCAKCRMQHKRNMCFTPMQQAHCLSYKIDDDKLCIFGHNILLLRSHIKKKLSLRHTTAQNAECNTTATWVLPQCNKHDAYVISLTMIKICIFGHNVLLLRRSDFLLFTTTVAANVLQGLWTPRPCAQP